MRELNYIDEKIEKNENPALRTGSVGRSALSTVYLMDCIEGMKQFPDKYFSLAVVDPPYGLGDKLTQGGTWASKYAKGDASWDIAPPQEYWNELFRVSKNQNVPLLIHIVVCSSWFKQMNYEKTNSRRNANIN